MKEVKCIFCWETFSKFLFTVIDQFTLYSNTSSLSVLYFLYFNSQVKYIFVTSLGTLYSKYILPVLEINLQIPKASKLTSKPKINIDISFVKTYVTSSSYLMVPSGPKEGTSDNRNFIFKKSFN